MTAADGYVVGTTKVVDHGPENARWDLVILGDGYKVNELNKYHQDVQNFVDTLRLTPPFDELFCAINVHRVDIVSTDSGADEPTTAGDCSSAMTSPKTFLDAKFCSLFSGSPMERLLTVDSSRATDIANAQVPMKNQVLVMVNSSKYGGAGGSVAVCSTHTSAAEIAIHEIGHSAFGLADEYGGNGAGTPAGEPFEPNVTRDDAAVGKWSNLIDPATPTPSACDSGCASSSCIPPAAPPPAGAVGTYEGAIYSDCDTYRPLPSCYMRDYGPFCPVCSQVIRDIMAPFLPAESINLLTNSINFLNVPAGMGGVGVTTHRAIVFEVVACRTLTFEIIAGPTGGFGTPSGTSASVSSDPILPTAKARIWLSYTSTNPGDAANGSVTVRCVQTAQQWVINISANTVERPRAAVSLVLDRSYSMTEDAGDAVQKIQKLRESCGVFVNLLPASDGIGVVRFNHVADRLMEITDGGGAAAIGHITGNALDPAGNTSIGSGVVNARNMLNDAQAAAADPYEVLAMVVLTDGKWNTAPTLADVAGSINANTYAVGLGLPSNISVPALTTLCQGNNGFLLVTGAITPDQSMRLSKYFLQVLAGVTNAQVVADPAGVLAPGTKHRIPFWVTEADYGMDLIVLSRYPKIIDFQLEAPGGSAITPGSSSGGANSQFRIADGVSYYRCALPVLPAKPDGSHAGQWHAVLSLDRASDRLRFERTAEFAAARGPGLHYEFVAHTYSTLTFDAKLSQSSYQPGAVAQLSATVNEYGVPVGSRAAVWAEVTRPDGTAGSVSLVRDADDQFAGQYALLLPGTYVFRIRASGQDMQGMRFERERTLTGATAPGADGWRPDDGRPDAWCEILECIGRFGLSEHVKELAKKYGIDLESLVRCLLQRCLPGNPEDSRGDQISSVGIGTATKRDVARVLDEIASELRRAGD